MKRSAVLVVVLAALAVCGQAQAGTPFLSVHRGAAAITSWANGSDGTARVHGCYRRSHVTVACTVDYTGISLPFVDVATGQPLLGDARDHMRATLWHGHVYLWSFLFGHVRRSAAADVLLGEVPH